ncbi:hypothetical protein HDU99_000738, partial [Rhizoclosmatium hyalinum]
MSDKLHLTSPTIRLKRLSANAMILRQQVAPKRSLASRVNLKETSSDPLTHVEPRSSVPSSSQPKSTESVEFATELASELQAILRGKKQATQIVEYVLAEDVEALVSRLRAEGGFESEK